MAKSAGPRLFGVSMKGERGIYQIKGWENLTINELAAVLSDVTGYREEFVQRELTKRFDTASTYAIKPSSLQWGETPTFIVGPSTTAQEARG